ncbi:MAG TPA: DUF3187 family protein [Gemmatimonadales bacterium]|jgi:hypothetical protein|nr:DUF3187 family protein [Gemmatimonadales bacterium]
MLAGLALPGAGRAQGLPSYAPINPVATSRSGLYFQPYQEPHAGRWTATVALDYASTIEYNELPAASYILDSEVLRLRLRAARDLDRRAFLLLETDLGGAYDGFLDGFLHWYHGLLGIDIPERERRPPNAFLYEIALPGRDTIQRRSSSLFLGDLRAGLGIRLSPKLQTVVSVTLPTTTGPTGYGRGTLSASLLNSLRLVLDSRVVYEGSLGVGYTPSHGELASVERTVFLAASSGLRYRFWGRQSLYANLFFHSPYYHRTTLPGLDRRVLDLDFGWLLATRRGPEWRIGMTEDPEPGGPAVDLTFRLGVGF